MIRFSFFISQILAKLHQNTNLQHDRRTIKQRLSSKLKTKNNTSTESTETTTTTDVDQEKASTSNHSEISGTEPSAVVTPVKFDQNTELTTIETACRIHEDLCDACYITEEYFSVVMLTIVTIGFLIIVFNAYYVLEVLFRHGGDIDAETMSFIVFLVYQMFIHGLGLVCIVQNSSAVLEEVRKRFNFTGLYLC